MSAYTKEEYRLIRNERRRAESALRDTNPAEYHRLVGARRKRFTEWVKLARVLLKEKEKLSSVAETPSDDINKEDEINTIFSDDSLPPI